MSEVSGTQGEESRTGTEVSSGMPLTKILSIFTMIFATPILLLNGAEMRIWALIPFAGLLLFCAAAVSIEKLSVAERIQDGLTSEKYRQLYDGMLTFILPPVRRVFGVAEPDTDQTSLPNLLRAAFTYRLLDRAMLFAVIYPLAALILFWGLSGRAGSLGDVTIIPAVDTAWKGYATLCGIAIVVACSLSEERFRNRRREVAMF